MRIIFSVLLFFDILTVQAEDKLAILIGIESYPIQIGRLDADSGPASNVKKMREALARIGGYKIIEISGRGAQLDLDETIAEALSLLTEDGGRIKLSFLYYSGHGAAAPNGVNYLVPIDASIINLWAESNSLATLIDRLTKASPKTKHVIVVDACRNDFNLTRQANGYKGFSIVSRQTLPPNILLAYAAGEGKSAPNNGDYASALATEIVKKGLLLQTAFLNANLAVAQQSRGEQTPWHIDTFKDNDGLMLAGELPPNMSLSDHSHDLVVEPVNSRKIIFVNKDSVEVYTQPSHDSGLIEVRGRGSLFQASRNQEVHVVRRKDKSAWVMYQTNWGWGYVPEEYVKILTNE